MTRLLTLMDRLARRAVCVVVGHDERLYVTTDWQRVIHIYVRCRERREG